MLLRDQNVLTICNSLGKFEDKNHSILTPLDSVNYREPKKAFSPYSFRGKKRGGDEIK